MNNLLGVVGAFVGLCIVPFSHAASMTWSTVPPTVHGSDIANFSGASAYTDNILGGDHRATFVASNQSAQGQTFTTGISPGGYELKAVTVQHVGYSTSWSLDAGWTKANDGRFRLQIGTISGGVFSPISMEDAHMDDSAPANENPGMGSSQYVTLTLDSPVTLFANTKYAFVISPANNSRNADSPYFELNGIGSTSDMYPGGKAISLTGTLAGRDQSNRVVSYPGDRVFYLDISARKTGVAKNVNTSAPKPADPVKHYVELLKNPAFESKDFSGWKTSGEGWSIDRKRLFEGAASALCTVQAGDQPQIRACMQGIKGISPGRIVEVVADVSGVDVLRNPHSKACIAVLCMDANNNVLKEYRSSLPLPKPDFQQVKIDDAVVLPGTKQVFVMLVVEVYQKADDADLWRFDNVRARIL